MNLQTVFDQAISEAKPVGQITRWSDLPGIYFIFFTGCRFPLELIESSHPPLFYIGKTLTSSASRDRDTHFKSGRTGSSTLRRTLGALLRTELALRPLPRSQRDIEAGRKNVFCFDEKDDDKLTEWMLNNLSFAFYPFPRLPEEIQSLEEDLIIKFVPALNIDRNLKNPHLATIQASRKQCSTLAYAGNSQPLSPMKYYPKIEAQTISLDPGRSGKYLPIWKRYLPAIMKGIQAEHTTIQLDDTLFKLVGNRKTFSFKLVVNNCQIENSDAGSAVARDLLKVLMADLKIKSSLAKRRYVFRLNNEFVISIQSM